MIHVTTKAGIATPVNPNTQYAPYDDAALEFEQDHPPLPCFTPDGKKFMDETTAQASVGWMQSDEDGSGNTIWKRCFNPLLATSDTMDCYIIHLPEPSDELQPGKNNCRHEMAVPISSPDGIEYYACNTCGKRIDDIAAINKAGKETLTMDNFFELATFSSVPIVNEYYKSIKAMHHDGNITKGIEEFAKWREAYLTPTAEAVGESNSRSREYLKKRGLKNPPIDSGISGGGDAPRVYVSDVMDAWNPYLTKVNNILSATVLDAQKEVGRLRKILERIANLKGAHGFEATLKDAKLIAQEELNKK